MESILSIVGAFMTLMLGVNAFFLKGIFSDLNDVKIKMASIFENANGKERRLSEAELSIKDLYARVREIELELRLK
jgi:hypothetical protein